MSVPPARVSYSAPPPNLNVPSPVPILPNLPPPQVFCYPPPSAPPRYVSMPAPALPPMNIPPPAIPPMNVPPPAIPPMNVAPSDIPPMNVPPPDIPPMNVPPPAIPPMNVAPSDIPPMNVPPPDIPPMNVPPPAIPPMNVAPSYIRPMNVPPPDIPPMNVPPPDIPSMNVPPPIRPYPVGPFDIPAVPPQSYAAPNNYPNVNHTRPSTTKAIQNWVLINLNSSGSHKARNDRSGRDSINRHSHSCTSKRIRSPFHEKKYDRDGEREQEKRYREDKQEQEKRYCEDKQEQEKRYREDKQEQEKRYCEDKQEQENRYRSHSVHSHSPSQMSHRDREKSYRQRLDQRQEYERKRCEYERYHSMSRIRDHRSHSRAESRRTLRSPSRIRKRSPDRDRLLSRTRELSYVSRHSRRETPSKPMTDREKILEEYRKNYCRTQKDLMQKMEQWSKKHKSDEEQTSNMWYRSTPAELYYKQVENGSGVQQTPRLEMICGTFFEELIERGRKARPEVDELPPIKPLKVGMCNAEEGSSSSESEDESLDEEGLQSYTERVMQELQRKQSHPRRLHPELWFNSTGEMNGGPLCRCSARARRQGLRHGVYANEEAFPKCIPTQSNIDKLYHYRITVSPPTNFLIRFPTMISHDEHEFLFSGFSMFSHYKLAKLPTCKVLRFNIEYTILYVEEPAPQNFTIKELDLFEEFLFYELLELVDLDLGKGTDTTCSQFHFMPRFVRCLPGNGCEVLSMCEVLKYLIVESGLLIAPETLEDVHNMNHYAWQDFVEKIKGMIVTYPGKKPCSVRVDQLDRSPPTSNEGGAGCYKNSKTFYPEIVHFSIRPSQLSYAGNPEYQKALRIFLKHKHLVANMAKPSFKEREKLAVKETKLRDMRAQSKLKRDVTIAFSSEGFHTTGLMCDVVQHAMLIPVLVRHLRFHKSLDSLEKTIGYVFKQRALLQTALTHPSYKENFGTNPDHARNSLTNCGIRQPEYGNRRVHYPRKKGVVTLINIMSSCGKKSETESDIKHNERLEFLGDAVVEFLSSIHLFRMFPGLAEGGLATYRASIVQNQHLAQLAKNIGLEQYMLYTHGSDLCREVVMRHAMANCFEAVMASLFLDAGIEVADRVFALALWYNEPDLLEVWVKKRLHPLQEQEPLGDRKYIKDFEFLQKLVLFENSIGVEFKHIRLLARAFTDRSVGFTHLTLGSNQRLEFLGDAVLQLIVSERLYRHFPNHHEGHLSLLRSSLVNNRTQSMVCDDLDMARYAIYGNPKAKPNTRKHKADLFEAFLGALYIDKNIKYCEVFCNVCLFPRLQEFIMNQDWNDSKSKLQQCCLTLRSVEGGEPDIPIYKVIECIGPTNTRIYTVGVYFRGQRLAEGRGHTIHEAEMNSAENALRRSRDLFPQLSHKKQVPSSSLHRNTKDGDKCSSLDPKAPRQRKHMEDNIPKAYRLDYQYESSEESFHEVSEEEVIDAKVEDSGLDSDASVPSEKLKNVQVSSLLSDMQRIKAELIERNEYDKLLQKCTRSDSDDD
ncbi:hypothetical protein PYW08_011787 [Mythimna loreyi]|uniref:Uncharacterized protein n=1 Tax=Mythimna loreyi TaxID=667449 RepID=A0ACC2QKS9_9NEOP|nr:hypothetical protein PYW08_011787 [Mythimna loreyi]